MLFLLSLGSTYDYRYISAGAFIATKLLAQKLTSAANIIVPRIRIFGFSIRNTGIIRYNTHIIYIYIYIALTRLPICR
jgi:hypothetical protein